MNNKSKLMAVFAVFAMLAVCFVPIYDEADATDGVFESLQYEGSWTWDTTTGLGPFNSFYAAFDMTNGNAFYAILNPYDLTKTIDGTSLSPMSNYNIMWVLPTVYWSVDANGDVTITNDSTGGGVAYAHTVDGHTYNYVAYGVYHAGQKTVGGQTVLTSESGVQPKASQTRATFRDYANNYTMDSGLGSNAHSMLWNFYQWTLYKLCCYTVMEDFNSQAIVGNGNVYGGIYTKLTGGCNTMGPYAGNNGDLGSSGANAATYGQDYAKLFIEEAWGTVYDFVDGVIINAKSNMYLDSSSEPSDQTSGTYITNVSVSLPSSGFGTGISTDARIWGIPSSSNSDVSYYDKGTTDYIWTGTGSSYLLYVGGYSYPNASFSVTYGVSYANTSILDNSYGSVGSRLAFVFDAGPAANGGASYSYTLDYTAADMATSSAAISVAGATPISHDVPPVTYDITIAANDDGYGAVDETALNVLGGSTIAVNGNVLTIGSTDITATPTADTDQYSYSFTGWYVDDAPLADGTVTGDMDITAVFARTINSYTVTINSNNNAYGTVDTASVTVPYGTAISTDANILTIGSTDITATPTADTDQYSYSFTGWTNVTGTVTGARTITADFSQTLNTFQVNVSAGPGGSITGESPITVDYGTTVSVNDGVLSIGDNDYTATASDPTAQYTYSFDAWQLADGGALPETITAATSITAAFTATVNTYTVTIQSNDVNLGTVDVSTVSDVPYGTQVSVVGDKISINGTVVTATAADGYELDKWSVSNGYTITGDLTITATFDEYESFEQTMLKLVPLLLILGLVMFAVVAMATFKGDGTDLIKLLIGLAVALIFIVTVAIPATGGL